MSLARAPMPRSFMKSQNFETGLSDCHQLFCSSLWDSFKELTTKIIKCRYQKHFDQKKFVRDLNSRLLKGHLYSDCDDPYEKLPEIFLDILDHHAPLKEKQIRGNHAPVIFKELSKTTMEKSETRNRYLKWPSRENYVSYKK